jgi:hypothetical protein
MKDHPSPFDQAAGIAVIAVLAVGLVFAWRLLKDEHPAPKIAGGAGATTRPSGRPIRTTRPVSEDMLPLAAVPWDAGRSADDPKRLTVSKLAQVPWAAGRGSISELAEPGSPRKGVPTRNNIGFASSDLSIARVPWSRSTTRPADAQVDTAAIPKKLLKPN